MRAFAFSFACILLCTTAGSQAATITYWLKEASYNTWELRAYTSPGDNGGLAAYGVALSKGSIAAASDHLSPRAGAALNAKMDVGPAGFTLRSLTQTATGSSISGAQHSIPPTPTPHIIYGFGQEAGSFAAKGLTPLGPTISPTWDSAILLAKVTNTTGGLPRIDHRDVTATLGQVFAAPGSTQVIDAQLRFRISVNFDDYYYPEPTSAAMLSIGAIGLIAFARRRNDGSVARVVPVIEQASRSDKKLLFAVCVVADETNR